MQAQVAASGRPMPELGDWLKERLLIPREAGLWDCCTLPCDWAVAQGWPDPMAAWRGTYASEREAQAIIVKAGGLLSLFQEGFEQAGIPPRYGLPQPGDVGVLRIGSEEAGSIYTGPRWAFVAERGLGFASVDESAIAAVWAVRRG